MIDDLPHPGPVRGRYDALVAADEIEGDDAQKALADRLDRLVAELGARTSPRRRTGSLASRLFGGRREAAAPIRGVYVHGPVGRGKTMLMDLFFEAAPEAEKRRVHFHAFMADVHDRVFRIRSDIKAGRLKGADPIPFLSAELAREARLLCFDEFSVTDIADAMILGRLFTRLFEAGVVMVATSNVPPDELYWDGLNRRLFLPFIQLLDRRCEVWPLAARTDFRMEKLAGMAVWLTPPGEAADCALDAAWRRIAGTKERSGELELKGRHLAIRRAGKGAARFGFAELCETPLGAADYLAIARSFHTVVIEDIPVFTQEMRNPAKRFINLIDVLYDHRVKLVASAAATPDELYRGAWPTEAFEFRRTASRLTEMQSEAYLAVPHGAARTVSAADEAPQPR